MAKPLDPKKIWATIAGLPVLSAASSETKNTVVMP